MGYRTLLVEAEPAGVADARLKCAVALAQRFEAVLVGVAAEAAPLSMRADPFNDLVAAYQAQLRSDLGAAEENFHFIAGRRDTEWRALEAAPADVLVSAACAADLIIAGGAPRSDSAPYRSADVGQVILRAARPVLVVPPAGGELRAEKIVIAWKDGREARRALSDALPFLTAAKEVLVLQLCDHHQLIRAQECVVEVAHALSRHGVKATGEAQIKEDCPVSHSVIKRADWLGADLIVAGAYGRSRLGEWALGGMTHDLLKQTERFVLFSH